MADKKQTDSAHIRYVRAILEVGEILGEVLTPEERRSLQRNEIKENEIKAKRRYRWNGKAYK